MPIPKPEKEKSAPRNAGHRKKDYGSLMMRAKVRRQHRAEVRDKRLARLRNKRLVGTHPLTEWRRRSKRLLRFGSPRA